jgi:hypothetical protein
MVSLVLFPSRKRFISWTFSGRHGVDEMSGEFFPLTLTSTLCDMVSM